MHLIRAAIGIFLIAWGITVLVNAGLLIFTLGMLIAVGLLWQAERV